MPKSSSAPSARALVVTPLAVCLATALTVGTTLTRELHADVPKSASFTARFGALDADELIQRAADRLRAGARPHANTAAAAPRRASTLAVTNCNDDGSPGSLRNTIAAAASGDTVDLGELTCATITLTQGEIAVAVDDLTVHGPGAAALTIDAAGGSRIFSASGAGTLAIDQVTLMHGYYGGSGLEGGGCIYTAANLSLSNVTVASCTDADGNTGGGGVSVKGDLTLESSALSNNLCGGVDVLTLGCAGGAAVVYGTLTVSNSTISGNASGNPDGSDINTTLAGAFFALGPIFIENSTISGNFADFAGAFVAIQSLEVHNSTITNNSAQFFTGGIEVDTHDPTVTIDLQSSIVFGNAVGTGGGGIGKGYNADIYMQAASDDTLITGSHNLVGDFNVTLPADTLTTDPLLQPLADNGGPTQTHALGAGSPAIDAGSNPDNAMFDQRGTGFARVAGAAADIGAFEVQVSSTDVIFQNGFDVPPG